jgi:hypothetical protein
MFSGGLVLQGPRVPQVLERLSLQAELLAASARDGCAPRRRRDTHGQDVASWRVVES